MQLKKPIQCPTCGDVNTWHKANLFRPFCSKRCRLIDLGAWADEFYSIASEDQPGALDTDTHSV